jgi:hypothetical protein
VAWQQQQQQSMITVEITSHSKQSAQRALTKQVQAMNSSSNSLKDMLQYSLQSAAAATPTRQCMG